MKIILIMIRFGKFSQIITKVIRISKDTKDGFGPYYMSKAQI